MHKTENPADTIPKKGHGSPRGRYSRKPSRHKREHSGRGGMERHVKE